MKSQDDIVKMAVGGEKLSRVKDLLKKSVKEGVNAYDVELLACKAIEKEGAKPSFKMVPGYSWATCVNINEGVVHGIPKKSIVFKKGDVVSVDVGIFYQGFHTDTSTTVEVGSNKKKSFLDSGRRALVAAIDQAKVGNFIYDISKAMEDVLRKNDLSPVRALVGHGIGRKLHEDPHIPCFAKGSRKNSYRIKENDTFAIEVMYTKGNGDLVLEEDGWTISTEDFKLAALFEETVVVEKKGARILTNQDFPIL